MSDPTADRCQFSKRENGTHAWKFDGDDPYIECAYCDMVRDAINGRVIRHGRPAPESELGFKEAAENLNVAPDVQGNVSPADPTTDTDRLAEEVDAIRAVVAAEEKGQRAYWGTDDVLNLLAWGDSLQERLDTAEGQLATSRHRHRPYPNAESPHAYCLSCLTGKKETGSNFPEYVKWPCPDAIDLGLTEGTSR